MLSFSYKWFLLAGALLGFIAVAAGAFGAHALKTRIAADKLAIFETAVRYQMYHALALILLALAAPYLSFTTAQLSGWSFFLGTLIFSGSLYLLALTGMRFFGAITPLGGILLLAGWLLFALSSMNDRNLSF